MDGHFYATQGPEIRELWIEGDELRVETFDAANIQFITSNRRAKHFRAEEWKCLNHAVYKVYPDSEYVRIIVTDHRGKTASSNAYFAEQLL